jgi:NADPH:quinone reductase-like Zn-dependent oxidoreductase
MRAILQDRYGASDALRMADIAVPKPGPDAVLIRVRAAGVNMADWHLMTGLPQVARLALGLRRPRTRVRGEDVAGIVEAVGSRVTGFAVGDEVLGAASGSFADFAVGRTRTLARKPAEIPWAEAGALPMAAMTALAAVRRVGLASGERVVVTGAGGGVGGFVVQLAAAAGCEVIAVCSAGKADFVRGLGAADVVDYARTDVTDAVAGVDAVIDFAGGRSLRDWRSVLAPTGRVVFGGAEGGGAVFGGLSRELTAGFATIGSRQRASNILALTRTAELEEVAALVVAGALRVPIAREYPLEAAPAAIDDLRAARLPGKLVVVP